MQSAVIRARLLQTLKMVASCLLLGASVAAQEPAAQLTAPPPPKVIVNDERSQLDAAKDPKSRVKLSLALAENHLVSAEQHTSQPNFEAASMEVGKYHALIDDVLKFVASLKTESNKTRDLYKRIELSLRADGPRLTAMRRITPLEYAVWIKEVEDFARRGRTEALNSFYGHTVVRETPPKTPSDRPADQKRKDNSLAPEKKQP